MTPQTPAARAIAERGGSQRRYGEIRRDPRGQDIHPRDEPSNWLVQRNRITRVSRRDLRRSARCVGLSFSAYG